ncbi:MAG TPA: DsbA family protein [Anaeromyxobacter sp.]|nr:DsbA family protein [Anaeromyxobacter sp.]
MPPRTPPVEPIALVLYEDPLSPWCLVAEKRIAAALDSLEGTYEPLRHEPFPLRIEPRAMSRSERERLARAARKAAKEPEAQGITPDLWLSRDPPLSSIPPLAALAAARLQGAAREEALRIALRQAALFRGVNVSRRDVLYELAERVGLDLSRFAGALTTPWSERRVRARYEEAVDRGVEVAPALVVGEEWLVAGPRSVDEYRHILERYAQVRHGIPTARVLH